MKNGQIVYSKPEAVFYTAPGKSVLFPVPVHCFNDITLLASIADGETIMLMNVLGITVLRKTIVSSTQLIQSAAFQSGQYFCIIYKKGLKVASGKMLIL